MAEQDLKREDLAGALQVCAVALESDGGPDEEAPLRQLQSIAASFMFLQGTDPGPRALAFVLDAWISDYYLNFAGDLLSPASEEIDRIRQKLLQDHVSRALQVLSSELVEGKQIAFSIEKFLVPYLDAIQEANKSVGEW